MSPILVFMSEAFASNSAIRMGPSVLRNSIFDHAFVSRYRCISLLSSVIFSGPVVCGVCCCVWCSALLFPLRRMWRKLLIRTNRSRSWITESRSSESLFSLCYAWQSLTGTATLILTPSIYRIYYSYILSPWRFTSIMWSLRGQPQKPRISSCGISRRNLAGRLRFVPQKVSRSHGSSAFFELYLVMLSQWCIYLTIIQEIKWLALLLLMEVSKGLLILNVLQCKRRRPMTHNTQFAVGVYS